MGLARIALSLLYLAAPAQGDIEVFLCPLHRDEQGARDGRCAVCGRPFEGRFLRPVWSCPMHGEVRGEPGGACPICRMALAPVTMEVQWSCARHPDYVRPEPGTCPHEGNSLEERIVAMPHGDHNPRHGGILFMAPDGFHHLEGVLTPKGAFRLYLYDNFTRPIDARSVRGRIDHRLLEPVGAGEYLELQLPVSDRYPVEVVLHARFGAPAPASVEERFDFVFPGGPQVIPIFPVEPLLIPDTPGEMVAEIVARARRIEEMMRRGAWNEIYIPALEAKSLALALEKKADRDISVPVKWIVRAAWLLDFYGDLGNRLKVESTYELFRRGTGELQAIYESTPPAR